MEIEEAYRCYMEARAMYRAGVLPVEDYVAIAPPLYQILICYGVNVPKVCDTKGGVQSD